MAKVQFSKLNIKRNEDINEINFNGNFIQVRQYLPIMSSLRLAENVLNNVVDEMHYYNPGKIDIFFTIEIIKNYTNIEFSDKELEKPDELYDLILTSGLYEKISEALPEGEIEYNRNLVNKVIESIYAYNNSVLGILNIATQDYKDLDLDIQRLQKEMADENNLTLLKDVVTKLG